MSSSLRIRIVENDLILILNYWLGLKVEDSVYIEMKNLEKSVNKIQRKEPIGGTNIIFKKLKFVQVLELQNIQQQKKRSH